VAKKIVENFCEIEEWNSQKNWTALRLENKLNGAYKFRELKIWRRFILRINWAAIRLDN
jgi:hypothetical protein